MEYRFNITPIPKPRMTRADAWKKRDCVLRYWAFKDELNLIAKRLKFNATEHGVLDLTFYLPASASWSKKKRSASAGAPHRQKPDLDNLLKSFMDCLLEDDSFIWKISAQKIWTESDVGAIKVIV